MDELVGRDTIEELEEVGPADLIGPTAAPLDEERVDLFKSDYGHSRFPVILLDTDLYFRWSNEAFVELFRNRPNTSANLPAFIYRKPDDAYLIKEIRRSLTDEAQGYSWQGRIEYTNRDRARVLVDVLVNPIMGENEPVAYAVYLYDVTSRHQSFVHGMFQAMLQASLLKDNDTGNHIRRVNEYAHTLARKLYGMPEYPEVDVDFQQNIRFLAAMHDVGKIGTPDHLIHKTGKLTDKEWDTMKEHTINGGLILSAYPDDMARDIALQHHERWDGSGYPVGLAGTMIALSARITAIADVYDALRMKRSYKEAYSHEKSVTMIVAESGKHFDPDLIDVFQKIHRRFEQIYEDMKDEGQTANPARPDRPE